MREHGKTDTNQNAIVAALRDAGATVQSLADIGSGCPDILCGIRGVNYLLEVKQPKARLTRFEQEWHDAWNGAVTVVYDIDGALEAVGLI